MDKPATSTHPWPPLREPLALHMATSAPSEGNPVATFGWVIYGLGARSVSGIVFLIGPLILIDAARRVEAQDDNDDEIFGFVLPHVLPTSLPSITVTISLFAQCLAAPILADLADHYGVRRLSMGAFVALGIAATVALGLSSPDTSALVQAVLIGVIFFSLSIAWMFQNSLLPTIAPVSRRPTLSLASTALSNLGGAGFLILQHRIFSASNDPPGGSVSALVHSPTAMATVPVATASAAVVAAAAAHAPPSSDALHLVCLLGAGWWLLSAVPALLGLSTLRAEPTLIPTSQGIHDGVSSAASDGDADADDDSKDGEEEDAIDLAASTTPPPPSPPGLATSASHVVGEGGRRSIGSPGGAAARRTGRMSFFSGLRRLRRQKHASRFVLAQVLYLTASTADGASASAFAQEVVGLDVAAITRLTIFAALAGAAGSMVTMGLARCLGARPTLCGLMMLPPLLLVYTSCILVSEEELLIVSMIHAFVSGGVGFHGLNRGVFAQMVPRGREAEFFGIYFVSIKAFSWMGPLACAVLNELTGSLRLAVLSALTFYVPAVLCLMITDFDEAKREAEVVEHTPRQPRRPLQPSSSTTLIPGVPAAVPPRGGDRLKDRLLGPANPFTNEGTRAQAVSYGTA